MFLIFGLLLIIGFVIIGIKSDYFKKANKELN